MTGTLRSPYITALLGAVLGMVIAIANGYAIFFVDSRAYIRGAGLAANYVTHYNYVAGWKAVEAPPSAPRRAVAPVGAKPAASENNGVTANRSIYYGFLLLIGYLTSSFWLTIWLQSYAVCSLIAIVFTRCLPRMPAWSYLALILGLAMLTTMGVYIAYMMPDIFTAVLILAVALLSTQWRRLTWFDRVFAGALASAALLFHQSNLPIFLAMAGIAGAWSLLRERRMVIGPPAAALALCLAIGFAGQQAFTYALTRATGSRPLLLPHLTAHLIDMGPGYRYIVATCPGSGFAVCRFEKRLPIYWEDFVGLNDPRRGIFAPADLATKHALSDEQISFAIHVLRYDPAGVVGGLARDSARQLVRFSPLGLSYTVAMIKYVHTLFPAEVRPHVDRSLAASGPGLFRLLAATNLLTTVGCVIAIVLMAIRPGGRWRLTDSYDAPRLATLLLVGVAINAVVCGTFASPLDRYQGRVVWLIPLATFVLATSLRVRRRAEEPKAAGEATSAVAGGAVSR